MIIVHFTAPVSSPREVSVSLITSSSFVLTWLPPIEEDVNGVITGYSVSLVVNETQETLTYNTTATNITLTQLHPFYIHHCSVTCITIASGPYSDPIDVQTSEDGKYIIQSSIIIKHTLFFYPNY